MGTDEKLKYPSEFVTDRRMSPELSFLITTFAFGITDPEASETTPVNVANMDWATAGISAKANKIKLSRQHCLTAWRVDVDIEPPREAGFVWKYKPEFTTLQGFLHKCV